MRKLWIVAGLLIGAGIGYYLAQESNKVEETNTEPGEDNQPSTDAADKERSNEQGKDETIATGDDSFPLKRGSQGKRVERLQVWLLRNLGIGGNVDGLFDSITEKRLYRALGVKELDKETYMAYEMGRQVHEQKILR
jgi:hypothetical protein